MTRIVVAEDDTLLGNLVAVLIAAAEDLETAGLAGDGDQALELVRSLSPDVLLLDVNLPGRDGWQVLRAVRQEGLPVLVVMMSGLYSAEAVRRARSLGAREYLDKRKAASTLAPVVRRVAAGERWFQEHPALEPASENEAGARRLLVAEQLTQREREVARGICEGRSNGEIAAALGISLHTAKTHVSHILWKLDAQSRADAARILVQRGLVQKG